MTAFYNENDAYPAQWTRNLIAAGHVAPGVVDERSICDLTASDVAGPGQRHYFAGIAGWALALRLAGVTDDASIWTASCPCQPLSSAGSRRGADDERHLWPALYRLVAECRPPVLLGEQVASVDGRHWMSAVRADLESLGYAVGAADLCAAGVGAPHIRQRLYFVAIQSGVGLADTGRIRLEGQQQARPAAGSVDRGGVGGHRLADADATGRGEQRRGRVLDRQRSAHGDDADRRGERYSGWATPVATELGNTLENYRAMKANAKSGPRTAITHPSLQAQLCSDPGPTPSTSPAPTGKRAQLNPAHSRWLMAFPRAWDDCAPTVTPSASRSRRRSPGPS